MGFWDTPGGFDPSQPQTITAPWTFTNGPASVVLDSAGMLVNGGDISTNGVIVSSRSGVITLNGNSGMIYNDGNGHQVSISNNVIEVDNLALGVSVALVNDPQILGTGVGVLNGANMFLVSIPNALTQADTVTFPTISGTVDVTP